MTHKTHGEWHNHPGNLTLEVVNDWDGKCQIGESFWDLNGNPVPPILMVAISALFPDLVGTYTFQVEINFLSSGSWAEKCWEHDYERDEDRVLDNIFISPEREDSLTGYNESLGKKLPADVAEQVFSLYQSEVEAVELEPIESDYEPDC